MSNRYQVFEPAIQPDFLRALYGSRWGAALGSVKDQIIQETIQGVLAKYPGLAPLDALGEIGQERGIVQGPSESTVDYIARLLNAWGAWTIGGTYWGLLAQLNAAGYAGAYIVATNGYVYGPSSGVEAPDPINGVAGTPPVFTQLPGWPAPGSAPVASEWAATTAYALGAIVTPTAQPGTWFTAIVSGTTGGGEPTWPGPGGEVADGGVVWAYVGNYATNVYDPPWTFGAANGQGSPTIPNVPMGTSLGGGPDPEGLFWSRFVVMFDPVPTSWNSISNPPTPTSAPSQYEIGLIRGIISKFKPGKSTCVGILALPSSGNLGCIAWPLHTTTNITFPCWLTRAIGIGDAPTSTSFVPNQEIYSWLPNTAVANAGGSTYIWTLPSFKNFNGFVFTSPASSGTTGLSEPSWPSTIGLTVSDNGITWTCVAELFDWDAWNSAVCFQA